MTYPHPGWHLPDPHSQPEFYADVPLKRLIAFVIDTVVLLIIAVLAALLSFGLALVFILPLWWLLNLAYRTVTLTNGSATLGMRLVALEFRDAQGQRFDRALAFQHSLGFMLSFSFFPLQIISIVFMLTDPRAQGLTDKVLGTVALNRRAGA
ncbi:RDD family protein [Marimonas lutisalis]|uniref:RDD family protein n=1 Tax=Marimonas lutisalis TaxID=2545756 RepID=UPI0010F4DFA5|nr:RDD family protein [Marimonas lutisalis]